jgi:hypothetical protein
MIDHTRDVPPHQHGGTDAPECTTCRPAPAPGPPEGPDREALEAVLIAHQRYDNGGGCICGWSVLGASHAAHQADAVLALLPTPPAPGCPSGRCEHRADAHTTHPAGLCLIRGCPCPTPPAPGGPLGSIVDEFRHGYRCEDHPDTDWPHDGCGGAGIPAPAPGDGEGLRAEVERLRKRGDLWKQMAQDMERSRDAALAARDTDQGAREALAEVERLVAKPWALRDQRGQTVMAVPIHDLRAALARATPEAEEEKP